MYSLRVSLPLPMDIRNTKGVICALLACDDDDFPRNISPPYVESIARSVIRIKMTANEIYNRSLKWRMIAHVLINLYQYTYYTYLYTAMEHFIT